MAVIVLSFPPSIPVYIDLLLILRLVNLFVYFAQQRGITWLTSFVL